jgi:hypothetical protein
VQQDGNQVLQVGNQGLQVGNQVLQYVNENKNNLFNIYLYAYCNFFLTIEANYYKVSSLNLAVWSTIVPFQRGAI